MHPEPASEAARWLRQAEDDLHTATRLREIEIHYASCFFAQQAAEKAVKAVLIARGALAVRGHSVRPGARTAARLLEQSVLRCALGGTLRRDSPTR